MKEIIEKEIKWCEEHRGMKSEVYEEAFIAGLKQALFLINSTPKSENAEKINKNLIALLNEALPYVSDSVGVASGARHVFHKILRITEIRGVDEDEI